MLGVSKDATRDEVVTAYRQRCRQCHPDAGGDEREFIRVQNAYEEILRRLDKAEKRQARKREQKRPNENRPTDNEPKPDVQPRNSRHRWTVSAAFALLLLSGVAFAFKALSGRSTDGTSAVTPSGEAHESADASRHATQPEVDSNIEPSLHAGKNSHRASDRETILDETDSASGIYRPAGTAGQTDATDELSAALRAAEREVEAIGKAFHFDGKTRILTPLERLAPVTLEVWVRPDPEQPLESDRGQPKQSRIGYFIGSDIPYNYGIGFGIRDDLVEAEILSGFVQSESRIVHSEWSHVAAVFATNETRIYVGGNLVKRDQPTQVRGGSPFVIGNHGETNPDGFFKGEIRSVRITAGERYSDDFIPVRRFESDESVVLLYDASAMQETRVLDQSGKGNHGEMQQAVQIAKPAPKPGERSRANSILNDLGKISPGETQNWTVAIPANFKTVHVFFYGDNDEPSRNAERGGRLVVNDQEVVRYLVWKHNSSRAWFNFQSSVDPPPGVYRHYTRPPDPNSSKGELDITRLVRPGDNTIVYSHNGTTGPRGVKVRIDVQ